MTIETFPKSLFGQHSYFNEQQLLNEFTKNLEKSMIFVEPYSVIMPLPLEKLPISLRRKKIIDGLQKSRETLKELGV